MSEVNRIVSVIIPTWNMCRFLEPLFNSIANSEFSEVVREVIFVCEKSNDGSEQLIQKLIDQQRDKDLKVNLIVPETRRGLFYARYLGAKAATGTKVFFIDSRITLPTKSARALKSFVFKYPAMCSNLDIDTNKNIYCLYWKRSHEAVFRKTHQVNKSEFTVDISNYDSFRIGGTSFYCSRDLFVQSSEKYLDRPLHSDDTFLFKDIIRVENFTVHPDYRINWEPRDTAKAFLKHLYIRGPGFAEYYIFTHRNWLFYAVFVGFVTLIFLLALLFVKPVMSLQILFLALILMAFSTAFLAKSFREFVLLAPLHTAVLISYGLGALNGTYVIWRKRRTTLQK